MGNSSSTPSATYARYFQEKHEEYPPDFGFKAPRKERVMKITEQEMMALQIPPEKRDYCAHFLREIYKCKKENAPFLSKCKHLQHEYFECQVEDYILSLKEIERSRRLKAREIKKQQMVGAH